MHLVGFIVKIVVIFAPHPHLHNVKGYTRRKDISIPLFVVKVISILGP